MILNLNSTSKKININEYGDSSTENVLYNPDGVSIHYGYDGKKVYGDEDGYAYSGIENTGGIHSIHLSRELTSGEYLILNWRNGYQLIIWSDGNKTRVKRRKGGSYQEIGKWINDGNSEKTCLLFNDNVYTKRFDKIETKMFEEF